MSARSLLTTSLCCALVGALAPACQKKLRFAVGDEVYGVLEEAVLEVTLRSASRRADARRFDSEHPFFFSFEDAQSARFERCRASESLERALAVVRSIRVRALVAPADTASVLRTHPPAQWTTLEIRDVTENVEPFVLHLKRGAPRGLSYAKLPYDDEIFLVETAILGLLDMRCPPSRGESL